MNLSQRAVNTPVIAPDGTRDSDTADNIIRDFLEYWDEESPRIGEDYRVFPSSTLRERADESAAVDRMEGVAATPPSPSVLQCASTLRGFDKWSQRRLFPPPAPPSGPTPKPSTAASSATPDQGIGTHQAHQHMPVGLGDDDAASLSRALEPIMALSDTFTRRSSQDRFHNSYSHRRGKSTTTEDVRGDDYLQCGMHQNEGLPQEGQEGREEREGQEKQEDREGQKGKEGQEGREDYVYSRIHGYRIKVSVEDARALYRKVLQEVSSSSSDLATQHNRKSAVGDGSCSEDEDYAEVETAPAPGTATDNYQASNASQIAARSSGVGGGKGGRYSKDASQLLPPMSLSTSSDSYVAQWRVDFLSSHCQWRPLRALAAHDQTAAELQPERVVFSEDLQQCQQLLLIHSHAHDPATSAPLRQHLVVRCLQSLGLYFPHSSSVAQCGSSGASVLGNTGSGISAAAAGAGGGAIAGVGGDHSRGEAGAVRIEPDLTMLQTCLSAASVDVDDTMEWELMGSSSVTPSEYNKLCSLWTTSDPFLHPTPAPASAPTPASTVGISGDDTENRCAYNDCTASSSEGDDAAEKGGGVSNTSCCSHGCSLHTSTPMLGWFESPPCVLSIALRLHHQTCHRHGLDSQLNFAIRLIAEILRESEQNTCGVATYGNHASDGSGSGGRRVAVDGLYNSEDRVVATGLTRAFTLQLRSVLMSLLVERHLLEEQVHRHAHSCCANPISSTSTTATAAAADDDGGKTVPAISAVRTAITQNYCRKIIEDTTETPQAAPPASTPVAPTASARANAVGDLRLWAEYLRAEVRLNTAIGGGAAAAATAPALKVRAITQINFYLRKTQIH